MPTPRGSALGLIPNETFTGGHVRLIPGDVFIFFTDGLYEAHNPRGEEFGVDRVRSIVSTMLFKSAGEIIDAIMKGVKDFVGDEPFSDDICVVAVEVTDKAKATDTRS